MILLSVVKEPSIFTDRCNFDAREDATGAITISTRKLELKSLNCSYKIKIDLKNSGQESGLLGWTSMFLGEGREF
jgi:predicted membrane GTPase involved in stress response